MKNKEDIIVNKLNNSNSEYKIKTSYKDLKPGISIDTSSNSLVNKHKYGFLKYSILAIIPIILIAGILIFSNKNPGTDEPNPGPDNRIDPVIEKLYTSETSDTVDEKMSLAQLYDFASNNGFSITYTPPVGSKDIDGPVDEFSIKAELGNNTNEIKLTIVASNNRSDKTTSEEHIIIDQLLYSIIIDNSGDFYITYIDSAFLLYSSNKDGTYNIYKAK